MIAARTIATAGMIAVGAWLCVIGGQATASAGTLCQAANGGHQTLVRGDSACSAKAGKGSSARAEESGGNGTAVAVADAGGQADAHSLQPKSVALAGAPRGGQAHSYTTGPGAMSVAQSAPGGTSIAIGGWGGRAVAVPQGTACSGGFAAAWVSNSGKLCIHSGSVGFQS